MTRDKRGTGRLKRKDALSVLVTNLVDLPPRTDFLESFWRRVDSGDADGLHGSAHDDITAGCVVARRDGVGACIPRDDVPSPAILAGARVAGARVATLTYLSACGADDQEADDVASGVVAYVEVNWRAWRLNVLARDPMAWERHIKRVVHRRWLASLPDRSSMVALVADAQAEARARIRALIAKAEIPRDDRDLLEHVFSHGFSVNETAIVFDLPPTEVARRLREALAVVRHDAGRPEA